MDPSEETFAEFVAMQGLPLLRTARLLTGDWHLGQDLVQVTLAKVYDRWARAGRYDAPVGYAHKVMVTTYCTWRRRRWHHELPHAALPDAAGGSGSGSAEPTAEAVAASDLLERALLGLPRRQRAVLVLRYYHDLTVEQTAEILGCPNGTVTSLTARALTRLRSHPDLWPGDGIGTSASASTSTRTGTNTTEAEAR
ncbi:SigE family RNA polymerase sigma factor [Streptomyces sp. NBC_01244]|uniref:SigE family RNA polymerase sigma factor n=1 Tax=Streptomyces sp. NBC_01244 TaxID=2903797 RepID=UPI002E15D377|nr:SigE family RNA polymerase sigma factor [Streptomyces sp. NBC_01244]